MIRILSKDILYISYCKYIKTNFFFFLDNFKGDFLNI